MLDRRANGIEKVFSEYGCIRPWVARHHHGAMQVAEHHGLAQVDRDLGVCPRDAELLRKLIDIRFNRTTADLEPGQFRAIGNMLEVMPVDVFSDSRGLDIRLYLSVRGLTVRSMRAGR